MGAQLYDRETVVVVTFRATEHRNDAMDLVLFSRFYQW